MITLSIIGAFILDNWNEERQNRKEEQVILTGLKKEFLENLDEVSRNIGLNEDVITATYEMIDLLRSEIGTWIFPAGLIHMLSLLEERHHSLTIPQN